jgi:hypothetical protein
MDLSCLVLEQGKPLAGFRANAGPGRAGPSEFGNKLKTSMVSLQIL